MFGSQRAATLCMLIHFLSTNKPPPSHLVLPERCPCRWAQVNGLPHDVLLHAVRQLVVARLRVALGVLVAAQHVAVVAVLLNRPRGVGTMRISKQ